MKRDGACGCFDNFQGKNAVSNGRKKVIGFPMTLCFKELFGVGLGRFLIAEDGIHDDAKDHSDRNAGD